MTQRSLKLTTIFQKVFIGKSAFEIMTPLSIENQVDILDAIIFKNIHPMRLCQMFQML